MKSIKNLFYRKDECESVYKLGKELGRGSFATVKLATHRKEGTKWAVKIIEKSRLKAEDEEALKMEIDILQKVEHPNIVELREVFDCRDKVYMMMEVMSGGELFDRIVAKEKYSELEAATVMRKICTALAYCHEHHIVHRDLKPENLLYQSPDDDSEIKIADFGLAKLLSEETYMMHTACGTPGYVAPEILQGVGYTSAVDMWSMGVILYILLCGFPPFYDENNAALFESIKAGAYDFPSPYWDDVSDDAKNLIKGLLILNPAERLTAVQVLETPWVCGKASDAELSSAKAQLRRFNARRKFKAGIMAGRLAARLRK
eukprot:CAMPEP_0196781266 /NCGR_PEP_ID=MMETSP1104-20130614/9371_1 /TAXON_ID=33652 /ORGANISM="Cafeteria sp., Strain Caron Lab Isolate" /LENGTH=316 /DNA_ID=CAMNT_0042151489 /DNA_START=1 /DNA_END=951 /DNA_ORIENTATION=+